MRRGVGAHGPHIFELSENNYGAWEWRGMFRAFKTYPPAQKMNVAVRHYEFMPPSGIRSGREKADNTLRVSLVYFPHRLGDPAANFTAIRRIHPTYSMPALYQAVGCWREKRPALGIFPSGAHIQGKMAVRNIPHAEQFPGRCLIHSFAGEMHVHAASLRVSSENRRSKSETVYFPVYCLYCSGSQDSISSIRCQSSGK